MDSDLIDRLMRLSALGLDAQQRSALGADLQRIIDMIDVMQTVNTDGVAPLHHPLDGCQPLRRDEVTEVVDRQRYQQAAPAVRDGLYLVPRVVE